MSPVSSQDNSCEQWEVQHIWVNVHHIRHQNFSKIAAILCLLRVLSQ